MTYVVPAQLLEKRVKVMVVGAGGSGSHIVNGLVQLHTAMIALGHPGGLDVTVVDDDVVSESNVGRQAFVWSDIGQPKATVLVNRLNQGFGLDWKAVVARLGRDEIRVVPSVVIGCVDNRAARSAIQTSIAPGTLWLDLGNGVNDGQVVLGEIGDEYFLNMYGRKRPRLPTVADLLPETINADLDGKDDIPSCSLADALEKQGLFINRGMALHALNLMWSLFRHGRLDHHGVFVNLATGRTSPLAVDPAVWSRFGYEDRSIAKAA